MRYPVQLTANALLRSAAQRRSTDIRLRGVRVSCEQATFRTPLYISGRTITTSTLARVTADVDEDEVGRIMVKYDLLAIPVVDEESRPLGIVTLDDALDAVLPDEWKQRLPRVFR